MSAPTKRHGTQDEHDTTSRKLSSNQLNAERLENFIKWSNDSGIVLNEKVLAQKEGSCAQYGLIAADNIKEGEILFQIPREHLLTPGTCGISDILQAAEKDGSLSGNSGWTALLVALMYEYNNPSSKWRPYLDLVPDFKELDLPMYWSSSERKQLLEGTGVIGAVDKDLENMEKEFRGLVLPFITKHKDTFSEACQNFEFYKQMVGFVMAYSFTEDRENDTDIDLEGNSSAKAPPVMVPMADILNHVARNNASLKFEEEALKMVAVKDIKKGEEVFNTYGQLSNGDLLHMYGFSEPFPDNHFDTVEITPEIVIDVAKKFDVNKDETLKSKMEFLQDMGLLGDGINIIIGVGEIMNDDEVITVLKVLSMDETDFNTYVDNEGWEEDLENESEESLSFENISKIPKQWKELLCSCANARLKQYTTTVTEDEEKLKTSTLSSHHRFSLNTAYGQKKLLHDLIEHLDLSIS